ncbi:ASCH domain-containing protein [Pedobacter sp. UC225_65]|uniref:ASCH domain-containing protein n=1 Tax=Pedobacter sp. UC225_65 TaxID=3350173 RepID=UPI00366E9CBD
MSKLLLISIKEKYVSKIISGKKTIELRKAQPKVKAGDTVIIYTTQPKKAVTAVATVKQIIKLSPEKMWASHKNALGIVKEEYDDYYKNSSVAVGIELCDVIRLDAEILLSAIKIIHPRFTPPQTFKYLDKFQTLRDYKNLSN